MPHIVEAHVYQDFPDPNQILCVLIIFIGKESVPLIFYNFPDKNS